MKRLLVVLIFLTLLVTTALPALAGEDSKQKLAPGWNELLVPTSPPARSGAALAYDTARRQAMLFGGYSNGYLDDTWVFDSALMTWTEMQPAHRPEGRSGPVMAYDEAHGVIVLFGGLTDPTDEMSDTWYWTGDDWQEQAPVTSPPPRWLASMAYDSDRQAVVLFGGLKNAVSYSDTWEFDGVNWIEQDIAHPSSRNGAAMAYDRRRNVMVLFGGAMAAGIYYNETWERSGSGDWVNVTPSRAPDPRSELGAVYFTPARRIVMYGGLKTYTYYGDTLAWNGRRWARGVFDPGPGNRCCYGMTYDPALKGVLLFGGLLNGSMQGDTWLLTQ